MYTDTLHPEISHGARMYATFPDQPSPCGYCKRSVLGNFGLGTRLVGWLTRIRIRISAYTLELIRIRIRIKGTV